MADYETAQKNNGSKEIGELIQQRLNQFDDDTALQRPEGLVVHELDWASVIVTELLGKGTFCTVKRVSLAAEPGRVYSLKQLDPRIFAREKSFRKGALDLALEAKLLSHLYHPNIIQIHGVRKGFVANSIKSKDKPYFIVLDYLATTLVTVLEKWKQAEKGLTRLQPKAKTSLKLLNRVESTALGIAKGMEYLHSKGIIFRDLKPQNIGFDLHGNVRIFDFGVAREMVQVRRQGEKLGFTGTPRYMANEVGAGEPYGLPADVYSFGILLWQICTLRQPFHRMNNLDDYQVSVVTDNARPPLAPVPSSRLAHIMQMCWNPLPRSRPGFSEVCAKLERYVSDTYASMRSRGRRQRWSRRSISEIHDKLEHQHDQLLKWFEQHKSDEISVGYSDDGSNHSSYAQPLINGKFLTETFQVSAPR